MWGPEYLKPKLGLCKYLRTTWLKSHHCQEKLVDLWERPEENGSLNDSGYKKTVTGNKQPTDSAGFILACNKDSFLIDLCLWALSILKSHLQWEDL